MLRFEQIEEEKKFFNIHETVTRNKVITCCHKKFSEFFNINFY